MKPTEWVVKNGYGWYWDLHDFNDEAQWVRRQVHACKFIERANAATIAKRDGGRVVRLAPRPTSAPTKEP